LAFAAIFGFFLAINLLNVRSGVRRVPSAA
jgi:hypothetical protein